MPVRRNIVRGLVQRVVGVHVWNGLIGEPVTIPRPVWDRVQDAADQLYEEVVRRIDWKRIYIEASARHLQLHGHRDGAPCGDCIEQALLYDERGFGLSALHPWTEAPVVPERTTRPDWAGVFADALRWRREDAGTPKAGVPEVGSLPMCEFDDCDDEEAPATAVVPLTSTGMIRPYRWVLSCPACVSVWQRGNPHAQPIRLASSSPQGQS
ncbi:hypothetical protein [Micromonospora sp. DT227]|uniref:hypothetical protein n=1 Tax=Micromonospora sp. DT227 TaxID=3393433 RepID=UPI003CEA8BAE